MNYNLKDHTKPLLQPQVKNNFVITTKKNRKQVDWKVSPSQVKASLHDLDELANRRKHQNNSYKDMQ
jgi:predicted patatin/cPLA2 family phospholipase